ncbi:MAG: glycoside hydrolase family 3 domain protein [Conexibacter sp.]|nr:glycoside hydrolase family 3 domain protein [Conexibacter sp.]
MRRRRRAVALLAALALLAGVVIGASGGGGAGDAGRAGGRSGSGAGTGGATAAGSATRTGSVASSTARAVPLSAAERARAAAERAPLERQLGQLLVIAFDGTTAPAYVTDALRGGRAAGVILFGGNAPSAASVRALTASLQRAAGGDAIVCLDQEGGDIRILAFAPPQEGQARQATPAAAGAAAAAAGRAESAVGVNVTLGPVADVASGVGSVMAGRAYPGNATAVAAAVRAAVDAYDRAGVAPALKHFPGLGGATVNTDDASARVELSRAQLLAGLAPYRVATPLVMVGHARYPALDADHIASQSPAIVTGLLRDRLGFRGVAMTDSMEARAVTATGDVGSAAVRAVAAGEDLLLLTGPGSFPRVRDALAAEAQRSPAFRAQVAEAAGRVAALRATLATAR